MKILYVSEYFPHGEITGGVEARAYYISKYLSEDHDVSVICSRQEGQPRESEVNGVKVYRVGGVHPYSGEGDFFSRLGFVESAIDKGCELDFDLVDGQSFLSYLPAFSLGEEADACKVATYHETWIGDWVDYKGVLTGVCGEFWERMSLDRDWDRLISVSEFTEKRLVERGVDPSLIRVIPNGVELSEFEKVKARDYELPTVCTVSRLTENKRIDLVMKAFEKVSEEIPRAQLKIVGKGPEKEKLEKLSRELDADIELLGYIPEREEVIKIMKSSDLFVSASTLEGFGISIIEAAASQTPYIASDIEPHIEITENEKGGLTFEKNNQKQLTQKITQLLKNQNQYQKKKKECTELAEKYDWKKITEKIEKTYKNTLKKQNKPPGKKS